LSVIFLIPRFVKHNYLRPVLAPFSFLWLCWLFLLPAGSAVAKASLNRSKPPANPSLAEVLRADGSLQPGVQGTFDARQFRMRIAPDGRPLFQPAAITGVEDTFWQASFGMAGPNYTVRTVVQAGTSLYVGGDFSTVGPLVAHNVAKWDGANWSSLGTGTANGVNGLVYSLRVVGADLYVGGRFSQAGGQAAASIAKWNGTTWTSLGSGLSNGTQLADVSALTSVGTVLYAGGTFTLAGGTAASNIARWDGTSWSALGAGISGYGATVYALAVANTDLYVGGAFQYAGGQSASCVAKWNGTTWSSLGSGIGTSMRGAVEALLVVGTELYAGGGFGVAGGVTVDGLAKWNGTSWSRVGGAGFANGNSNGVVTSLAFLGNDLYITGYFQQAYGAVADYLAKWNGTTWSGVGGGIGGAGYGVAHTLLVTGTEVYVGGRFSTAGGIRADNIGKWNGTSWSSLGPNTTDVQGLDQAVYALGAVGSAIYAGGAFQQAGSTTAAGLARWDGASWTSLTPTLGVGSMQVRTVAIMGTEVYVGGNFNKAGSVDANNVAKWDGTSWSSLGTGFSNGVNGSVQALAVTKDAVYVGGTFTQAGGVAANYVAKWNGTRWSALGSSTANGVAHPTYAIVQALAVLGSDVYVGGQFRSAGGTAATNLARWNGTSWSAVGTGTGPNGLVTALTVVGPTLYVGGGFTQVGGVTANSVATWEGTTWASLGTGANNGVTGIVYALAVAGSDVYVGGQLNQAGGSSVQNLAKWNGTGWSRLGTGTNGSVRALAVIGNRLYAGGLFTGVGDESKVMNYFGVYESSVPTATTNATNGTEITVYPNPASQIMTLTLPAAAETRVVQLLNLQGKVVRQASVPAHARALTVSLSDLSVGVYVLHCGAISRRVVVR
jgi:hypothetical protein